MQASIHLVRRKEGEVQEEGEVVEEDREWKVEDVGGERRERGRKKRREGGKGEDMEGGNGKEGKGREEEEEESETCTSALCAGMQTRGFIGNKRPRD